MIGRGVLLQENVQPDAAAGRGAAVLLALVPAGMLLVLLLRPIWDVDIFWQLRLGELILDRLGPVRQEPFAALHLGEPLPAVAWLGQAAMAAVRLIGGWDLLRLFDALCWLGGFWAVGAACRARGASRAAVALALGLAFLPALPTASIRPQSFAALCFGLLLALERLRLRPVPTIALGAPLLVLWQNLHPSVTVGAMAMGVTALAGWVGWLRDRACPRPWAQTALAAIGCAAVFATPDGISVLAVSARNAEASIAIGAVEWLPLWIPPNRVNALPIVVVALLALWLVLRSRVRVSAGELAVALALFALTATAYRFVLFWAVAIVPVIARAATVPGAAGPPLPRKAVLLPILFVALLTPLLAPTRYAPTLPLSALARLRQEQVCGTVYGDFPYGGAIIDVGWPDWRVAYDGRYYRYSSDEWKYNGGIENGFVPLVDVVRKWRPAAFVLHARHNAPLAGELARSRAWRRIYDRGGVVVYVPRSGRAAGQ